MERSPFGLAGKVEQGEGSASKLRVHCKANLDDKKLEHIRGFLLHLSMMYKTITPLLKGLYLTLAKHLPQ
jgi:hypothetical protein